MYLLAWVLLTGACISLLLPLLQNIYSFFFSAQRHIPGPPLARFTKLYYFYQIYAGHFEHVNISLHRKYRSRIVRVAPRWYSVSNVGALKSIYGSGSKFIKADWYEGWKHPDPEKYGLFTDRNISRHAQDRRKFAAIYSMSAMVSYETYVHDRVELFKQRLDEFTESGETIDLAHWLRCFVLDVIGTVTFSDRFGFLDAGKDIGGVLSALDSNSMFSTLSGVYSGLHQYIFPLVEKTIGWGAKGRVFLTGFAVQKWIDRKKQAKEENGKVAANGVSVDVEQQEMEDDDHDEDAEITAADPGKQIDMLEKFKNKWISGKQGWTERDVLSMTVSNMIAGSDTTAIALSAILYYLLKTPSAVHKLRAEIDKHDCSNGVQSDDAYPDTPITFKASQQMPYLQAVIKEGIRLHPSTGLPFWREVPEGGATISGQRFEAGDVVGANSWVLAYDTEVYGDDAAKFRPERWLESDEETLAAMERNWIPFGMGTRTCIGKNVAMLQVCTLIPWLIRRYDFQPVGHGGAAGNEQVQWTTLNHFLVKQKDFMVKVSMRK